MAYLPSLGSVRLRLTAKGVIVNVNKIPLSNAEGGKIKILIGRPVLWEEEGDNLWNGIAQLLTKKGLNLSTAESFTGGKNCPTDNQ